MGEAVGLALLRCLADSDLAVAGGFGFLADLAIAVFDYSPVVVVLVLAVAFVPAADVDLDSDFALADSGYFLDSQAFPLDFGVLRPP